MEEMDIGFQKGGNIVGMGQIEVQIKFFSFLPAWKMRGTEVKNNCLYKADSRRHCRHCLVDRLHNCLFDESKSGDLVCKKKNLSFKNAKFKN